MDVSPTSSDPPLSAASAEALVERIAQLGESGAPLAAGLRAAAAESDSYRLAQALRSVASEVERGRPLAEIVAGTTRRLPPHLAGLIDAAQRTGKLGLVLSEWIENRRRARQQWRSVTSALAYPAFTIVLAVVIYILFASFVVQPFRIIVEEFQLTLPVNTTVLFWVSSTGLGWFVSLLGVLGLVLVALRLIGGRAAWSWMMAQLPLVGGAWQCTGAAEMLRGLSLLTEHRIPLPDALRLAGGGITDAYVGQLCRDLATRVEQGSPLFMAILEQRTLPLSIVPIVRWGEQHGLLGEGLKSAAEMLEGRLRMRSLILIQVIPPLALLVVGVLILSLVGIITSTLFSLLQGLI